VAGTRASVTDATPGREAAFGTRSAVEKKAS